MFRRRNRTSTTSSSSPPWFRQITDTDGDRNVVDDNYQNQTTIQFEEIVATAFQSLKLISENSFASYLVIIIVIFTCAQTVHIRTVTRLKNEVYDFLLHENGATDDDHQLEKFLTIYDCHSVVSCVHALTRRFAGGEDDGQDLEHDSNGNSVQPNQDPSSETQDGARASHTDRFHHYQQHNHIKLSAILSVLSKRLRWETRRVSSLEHVTPNEAEADETLLTTTTTTALYEDIELDDIGTTIHIVFRAIHLKESLILDRLLLVSSISAAQRERLRQEFGAKTVVDLIGSLLRLSSSRSEVKDLISQLLPPLDAQTLLAATNLAEDLSSIESHPIDDIIRRLRHEHWTACVREDNSNFWTLGAFLLTTLVPLAVIEAIKMITDFPFAYKEGKCGFLTFITGSYLAPQNCKVIFDWKSNNGEISVCSNIHFVIKFYQRNYKPYPITAQDQLSVHITNGSQVVPCSIEFGDRNPALANVARVSFSAKKSGHYTINVFIGSTFTHIRGSPFKDIYFRPLDPSPSETAFVNHCSTVVCTMQSFHALVVELRDRFGNLCPIVGDRYDASDNFTLTITELVTDRRLDVPYYWKNCSPTSTTTTTTTTTNTTNNDNHNSSSPPSSQSARITLLVMLPVSGIYHAIVSYKGALLKNGDFNIVCLTESEAEIVRKCSGGSKSCYFNAKLLPPPPAEISSSSFGDGDGNFSFSFSPSINSLMSSGGASSGGKTKNVICYISPKQLTIKEYIFKFIPKRVATFRLSPSTKFYFVRNYCNGSGKSDSHLASSAAATLSSFSDYEISAKKRNNQSSPSSPSSSSLGGNCSSNEQFMIIDDGSQTPIELLSDERNIIVAVFTHFLLNKIGGSETFQDKQYFFNAEIRRHHQRWVVMPALGAAPPRVNLKVDRESLLESSIRATKSFGVADWCKRFVIEFANENGIDWGGVRREWYELLCKALFEPSTVVDQDVNRRGGSSNDCLFVRFKHDKQGLIHPNRAAKNRYYHYEFAGKIVGKCLLDTALGASSKSFVNARFSRSFLAQLIGLRVNYRYFERDDPDLYVSKIKFILDNDVTPLDLCFAEEEYDPLTGRLLRIADLVPNGLHIRVTEQNKLRYLDALAQYRLATCVKDQVEAFLRGLHELIPDNLLSIFDENELELLICGAATYSVSDLRLNHVVTGATYDFQKVVDWFWRSTAAFTDEEFARLLQFTTGCSHLPPAGFADLNPRFQISASPTFGTLPTAHTCFNQICLPDYDSFQDFDRSLRIAITEGSEGFGLV